MITVGFFCHYFKQPIQKSMLQRLQSSIISILLQSNIVSPQSFCIWDQMIFNYYAYGFLHFLHFLYNFTALQLFEINTKNVQSISYSTISFSQLEYNERRCLCTLNILYNEKTVIGRLHQYFAHYFEIFSAPTAETSFLLVLSMLAMESADSIRSLYRHFLSGITNKSLNAFYYACSYAKADYSKFMNITAGMALKLIPENLASQPIFLCIDDTMVASLAQNLRMSQNSLTTLHTMSQII